MAAGNTTEFDLNDPLIDLVAERFRVLGEPMRLRLLNALRAGDASVGELRDALGASQQNVSKHLAILHQSGMVARSKSGNQTRYRISDESVFELCDLVCGGVRERVDMLDSILRSSGAA
ncbi:MAG: winged helix-turn-helix transcriptional regulator [Solirubrobacterales bacterium]|nr:winged helix-turn-helix transcriptional regulator [Solirubrobacterales bacterium]